MIEDVTNVLPARTSDDGARPTVLFIGDIGQEFIQLCSEEVRCPELQGLTKVLHVHPSYWQCVSFVTSSIVCGETQSCAIVLNRFVLFFGGPVSFWYETPPLKSNFCADHLLGFLIPIELLPVVR